jgi:hypothetical protein
VTKRDECLRRGECPNVEAEPPSHALAMNDGGPFHSHRDACGGDPDGEDPTTEIDSAKRGRDQNCGG